MKVYRIPQRTGAPSAQALADAHARASEQHPEASRIRVLWTPASEHAFHAEVWTGSNAQVIAC